MRTIDPAAGLAQVTLAGILVTDPELRHTSTGVVTNFTVAAQQRRFDPAAGQWVDTGTTFLPCFIGRHAAENAAESLAKGTRVLVTSVLQQREWETTTGDKRSAYEGHRDRRVTQLRHGSGHQNYHTPRQ